MTPSKVDIEDAVEGSEGKQGEREDVSSITSSLTRLTLHTDTSKDLAKVEADLAHISLRDTPGEEEDFRKQEDEAQERKKEVEEDKEENAERTDSVEEIEEASLESKKVPGSVAVEESKEKEDGKEEETKEEEEEVKKEEAEEKEEEVEEIKKREEDKVISLIKETEKEWEDDKEEDEEKKKKEEEEEEEVSDDENPADEDEVQRSDTKLRSRGLGVGDSHAYVPSQHTQYMGAGTYQPQQTLQPMYAQEPHPYSGVWSPQHGQVVGYPGASPTHSGALEAQWYGNSQLDSEGGNNLIPSLVENSPLSCSSDDGMSGMPFGYSAESPQCYQDGDYSSPQYLDNQASPYNQSLLHTSQYQNQASPYNQGMLHSPQYQNQASSYNQGLSQSPQYQNQASPYNQGLSQSPQYQNQASPYSQSLLPPTSQCRELSSQEALYRTQMSPSSASFSPQGAHSSLLTPPVSPKPSETPTANKSTQEEELLEIISFVMNQVNFDISPHDSRIIEIKKNLLDIDSSSQTNLEDELDDELYEIYYRQYAGLQNEALVEGDSDGDILYCIVACTGQKEKGYNEKLVAFTKRVEKMDLCCDRVVDLRLMRCQQCGNSDPETFYSPLSWRNNRGEMLLSNLVVMSYEGKVIQYITKKVMQRPMDFKRTFTANYRLFWRELQYYPCLLEGLTMLSQSGYEN